MDAGFVLPFKSEILRLKLYAVGDSLCPLGRSGFCVNFAHKECQFSAVSTICQDFLPWLVFEHLVQDSFSVEKLQLQNLWCEFSLLRAGCMREKHESRSVGLNRHLSPRKPLGCREVLAMEYFRGGPPEVLVPDHCPRSLTPVTWEVWNLTCWSEQRKMIYQLSESPRSWNQPVLPWEP